MGDKEIDKVIEAVWKKNRQCTIKSSSPDEKIELAIYMEYDYFHQCLAQIKGPVSQHALEFSIDQTIMNFPIHIVIPGRSPNKNNNHPDFRVIQVGEKQCRIKR